MNREREVSIRKPKTKWSTCMGNQHPVSCCASVRTVLLWMIRYQSEFKYWTRRGKYALPGPNSSSVHITTGLHWERPGLVPEGGEMGLLLGFLTACFSGNDFSPLGCLWKQSHTATTSQLWANTKGPTFYTLLCGTKPLFMWRPNSLNYGLTLTKQFPESGFCQLTLLFPKNWFVLFWFHRFFTWGFLFVYNRGGKKKKRHGLGVKLVWRATKQIESCSTSENVKFPFMRNRLQ